MRKNKYFYSVLGLLLLLSLGIVYFRSGRNRPVTRQNISGQNDGSLSATIQSDLASTADLPPQGLYDYCNISEAECLDNLDRIGAAGFQLVLDYTSGSSGNTAAELNAYLDRAGKNGLKVIWDFNELVARPDAAEVAASVVNLVKNHPATWGYYVGDENPSSQEALLRSMSSAIRAADPDHPRLFVGNYSVDAVAPFADDAEVLGLDVYPIGSSDDSAQMVGEVGAVAKNLQIFNAPRGKKTALVLQAFSWKDYAAEAPAWNYQRWPTRAEMRQMRDQARANSDPEIILWFAYNDIKKNSPSAFWDDLTWAALGSDSR